MSAKTPYREAAGSGAGRKVWSADRITRPDAGTLSPVWTGTLVQPGCTNRPRGQLLCPLHPRPCEKDRHNPPRRVWWQGYWPRPCWMWRSNKLTHNRITIKQKQSSGAAFCCPQKETKRVSAPSQTDKCTGTSKSFIALSGRQAAFVIFWLLDVERG